MCQNLTQTANAHPLHNETTVVPYGHAPLFVTTGNMTGYALMSVDMNTPKVVYCTRSK